MFDDVHSASHISAAISISYDKESNITASIDDLIAFCQPRMGSTYFHVRCVCHILNLCVKDGLDIMNAKFKPIGEVTKRIWESSQTRTDWKQWCHDNQMAYKQFPKDVFHRWSSTYKLFRSCKPYRDILISFALYYFRGVVRIESA